MRRFTRLGRRLIRDPRRVSRLAAIARVVFRRNIEDATKQEDQWRLARASVYVSSRTWVGVHRASGVRFDVSTLRSGSATTTCGIKDVDCYRRPRASERAST